MPAHDQSHYRGSFGARSRAVRAAANADPSTRCRRCGLTMAEFVARFPDRKAAWQAGHTVDGHQLSALSPEHAWCNASDGARKRNRVRVLNNSERWY